MIASQDRSGWIGASDTNMVVGNWETASFRKWWLVKLGLAESNFRNREMLAGKFYEHRILEYLGIKKMDRQIKFRSLRLRVNLDGESRSMIHEVKTHKDEVFKVSKRYWQQCQVEAFAAEKPVEIVAYRLTEEDYGNYFNEIDPDRISRHFIQYDKEWIENVYLPRLKHLAYCLKKRRFPCESDVKT